MKSRLIRLLNSLTISLMIFQCGSLMAEPVSVKAQDIRSLVIKTAIYPEGIGYDSASGLYFVGSLTSPTVYQINSKGEHSHFLTDRRLISSAGIHVDGKNERLLVASLDLGTSTETANASKGKLAGLGIYDLHTGKPIHYINLAKALPGAHLANGITVDEMGNIYVTDSSSPKIYKIDRKYRTSVFLENTKFTGEGFNLNGIIYNKKGFLIVTKYNSNTLYRIPVNNPEAFEKIELDYSLSGPDGLVLLSENALAVIQNMNGGKISFFKTNDNWQSANHTNTVTLKDAYPTSGVVIEKGMAVIDGHINKLASRQTNEVKNFSIIELPNL